MVKALSALVVLAALAACSPASHCPHCATKEGHKECCGSESGICPHGGGEHKNAGDHNEHSH